MNIRKSVLIGLCVATLGGMAVPAVAGTNVGVYLNFAPPAPRYERVPAPRPGYIWVQGYWDADHRHHVWRKGHWERARRGYYYTAPAWVEHGNRWELQRGGWHRGDRDRDGVPNRFDRRPDNPYRR